jgi:hypothetical protein
MPKMKVTTIRFGEDLWEAVSAEARNAGVSTSQFIREAALARAASAAGARGEAFFQPLSEALDHLAQDATPAARREIQRAAAALTRAMAINLSIDSEALRHQSEQRIRYAQQHRRDY